MNVYLIFTVFFFLTIDSTTNGIAIDDFHCKVPTCRDFYYGLKKYPNHKKYVDVCYDTVFGLQGLPQKGGKCVDEKTGEINSKCIYAVAELIRKCMNKLEDTSPYEQKYYCGYTLMKYCAVHVGLERFPLNWAPSH